MDEREIRFTAGALRLEGRLALPEVEPKAMALICHPHPQFGGTMENPVVLALRDAAVGVGAGAIRFNFRGVGGSKGTPGSGGEERDDLRGAVAFARREWPKAPLWVAGYSFGAAVAAAVLREDACAERAVLVAPPLALYPGLLLPQGCSTLVVVGDRDPFCPVEAAMGAAAAAGAAVIVIPGCDHFFGGREAELRAAVSQWLRGKTETRDEAP